MATMTGTGSAGPSIATSPGRARMEIRMLSRV